MRRLILLTAITLLVFALSIAMKNTESPLPQIREMYLINLEFFHQQSLVFHNDLKSDLKPSELQASFRKLRASFKQIEFMLDYLQPQDVKDHLNGAPLPKTERNAPRLVLIEPKGMQRIEELLYAEEPDRAELLKLSKEFSYQLGQVYRFAPRMAFDDRQVFEAMRMGLVRIMSLGITGFDTPGSEDAIAESAIAWKAISDYALIYLDYVEHDSWSKEVQTKFADGYQILLQADFETFDRADFIRNYLHPLYGDLLILHQSLHYETLEEVFRGQVAYNYHSADLFAKDFFNLSFFTGLQADAPEFIAQQNLGKLLFFDPVLSEDLDKSCASCHNPNLGFSDGRAKSLARGGGNLNRNAPGLYNALYAEKFFYDLRADRMETQMEHVIFSEQEFGSSYKTIFRRLAESAEYQALFRQAFPQAKGEISRYQLSQAIMAFMSELSAFDTKIDRYLRGEAESLSEQEHLGFNLFMGKAACATCHFAPNFSGLVPPFFNENESEVLGVLSAPDSKTLDADLGRYAGGVVQDEAPFFKNSFKTVGLRNVALTAPYFHNGAYPDLMSVLEFYNNGGGQGAGLDLPQQTLPADSLGLEPFELEALEAFMRALTDTSHLIQVPSGLPKINKINRQMSY